MSRSVFAEKNNHIECHTQGRICCGTHSLAAAISHLRSAIGYTANVW